MIVSKKQLLVRLGKAEAQVEKDAILLATLVKENEDLKRRLEVLEKGYEPLFGYFLESKREEPNPKGRKFAPKHTIHPDEDYEG